MKKEYPDVGDFVIGTVETVKDYGAFVNLDEYPNKKGFIHVSEIASGWIKYIRDYVREGQKVVCQVIDINKEKGHIDLSLKRVNEHQRREKVQEWKNEQRAKKLMEIVVERSKLKENVDEIINNLESKYGTLIAAFESAAMDEEAFEKDNKGEWVKSFIEVAKENIEPSKVRISGYVEMTSNSRNAIDDIKAALLLVHKPDEGITIQYTGAPRYRIVVDATDYKMAEEKLKDAANTILNYIKKHGGTGEFFRKVE